MRSLAIRMVLAEATTNSQTLPAVGRKFVLGSRGKPPRTRRRSTESTPHSAAEGQRTFYDFLSDDERRPFTTKPKGIIVQ
jgi:hypothetical protein